MIQRCRDHGRSTPTQAREFNAGTAIHGRTACVSQRSIRLGAVIIAAQLRPKRVIVALALLYTVEQHELSSGPTIQLGAVIIAARLRLRRVIVALTLLYTAGQRVVSSARRYSSVP